MCRVLNTAERWCFGFKEKVVGSIHMESRENANKKELADRARQTIEKILYLTIATADRDGQPWNSPVYSAYNKNYEFYWASWTGNQHSKNIHENEKTFVVIYDSTVPEGTGFGVYMKGKSRKLEIQDTVEIVKALGLLYSRKNKKPRKIEEFLGLFSRRVYKFVPEQVWVNADELVKGNHTDTRIDVTNEFLEK